MFHLYIYPFNGWWNHVIGKSWPQLPWPWLPWSRPKSLQRQTAPTMNACPTSASRLGTRPKMKCRLCACLYFAFEQEANKHFSWRKNMLKRHVLLEHSGEIACYCRSWTSSLKTTWTGNIWERLECFAFDPCECLNMFELSFLKWSTSFSGRIWLSCGTVSCAQAPIHCTVENQSRHTEFGFSWLPDLPFA